MGRTVREREDAVRALATAFRTHGYEGASLAAISRHTGLGKGSLYNYFPGGKEDMAAAVLTEVGDWFRREVNEPLRSGEGTPARRVATMFETVEEYFASRQLVCLFGAFALGQERETFAARLRDYFTDWIDALRATFPDGLEDGEAIATDLVASIQGALVLARALDDPEVLRASLTRARASIIVIIDQADGKI